MSTIVLLQPKRIVYGPGCAAEVAEEVVSASAERVFLVTSPPLLELLRPLSEAMEEQNLEVRTYAAISSEPTIAMFEDACEAAGRFRPDVVIGFGGGSPLDVAKLVAALHDSNQTLDQVFGINRLAKRRTKLICLPTTSGTGSEVSPNALLLDEASQNKKAVVSPHLVPDAAYVDPSLTLTLPKEITAMTGLDALTHSIEAYTNKFAHPAVDLYALESIRLIGKSLVRAVSKGDELEARSDMALASLYGGLCLGPVNTAAVHALAYPLGGEYHLPHGLSNAVLLPHVLEFNLPSAPARFARIAEALGVKPAVSEIETARLGLRKLRELIAACGIETRLSSLGISEESIPAMARSAMTVTRLLKNNPRPLSLGDAESIYRAAL